MRRAEGNRYVARGTLSLKGVKQQVEVPFTWTGSADGATMEGELSVKRGAVRHRHGRVGGERRDRRGREGEVPREAAQGRLKMRRTLAPLVGRSCSHLRAVRRSRARAGAPGEVQPPAEFPQGYYRQAVGRRVSRRSGESLVVIEVRRAGSLARLGHDHVVASHDVNGYVAPQEGRADLYVPLARLAVDEAALRAEAGFDTQPTESDIGGTRANMLEKVLEARQISVRADQRGWRGSGAERARCRAHAARYDTHAAGAGADRGRRATR